jgi:hypothetical protein
MKDLHKGRLRIAMDQRQNWTVSTSVGGVAAHSRAGRGLRERFIELRVKGLEINHLVEFQWFLMTLTSRAEQPALIIHKFSYTSWSQCGEETHDVHWGVGRSGQLHLFPLNSMILMGISRSIL